MTIQLPHELESSINAAVHSGRFASADDAVAEMVRDYLRRNRVTAPVNGSDADPVLGCMSGDTELMDEIVAEAYRQRQDETWRELDL